MISPDTDKNVSKILGRLKQADLIQVLKEWNVLDDINLENEFASERKLSKRQAVGKFVRICKDRNVTRKRLGELDLICTQHHPESQRWCVYQLTKLQDSRELQDPQELTKQFGRLLSLHLKHDLNRRLTNEAVWIRVGLLKKIGNTWRIKPVFIVFHPHSSYLFMSAVAGKEMKIILQMLLEVLGCSSITEVPLSGRDVHSLFQMTLQRYSQGSFSKFRLNEVDPNPLLKLTGSRKRKATASCLEEIENFQVSHENLKEDEKRKNQITRVFGSSSLPKIQKLEFKMATKLRGTTFPPAFEITKKPFNCTVQFHGPSVIEGIKELSEAGLVSLPLPHHLANVHSLGKNRFLLADKERPQGKAGKEN